MDYKEPCCIFDASQYTGTPDAEPCPQAVDVPAAVRALDALYNAGREDEAEGFLEDLLQKARAAGDWRAELSLLSELLGQYRRSMHEDKGLRAVSDALALIRAHRMGQTVSAATVMLNAATTLKCFGRAEESIPIFTHAARVYADHLDPGDYRFAGLYNNMALSYDDLDDVEAAERYFRLALKIIEKTERPGNDCAVTWCNLAELYGKRDADDPRVEQCLDRAWECLTDPSLPLDGYHAFTLSKCIPTFDHYGYFLYAKRLRERMASIHART
ncbi:MAG: tetratricopeptide repeat protein [Oscillospiraceae bacterium]|nr:tetratricopeptide repeat protein [Oscillospiraceae bacterium]